MNEREDDLTPAEKDLLGGPADSLEGLHRRHSDCPSPELLLAAHSKVLPDESARILTAHLATCTFCQILTKDLTSGDLLSGTAEENLRVRERVIPQSPAVARAAEKKENFLGTWFWKTSPVALAAAAMIALAFWMLPRKTATTGPPQVAAIHQSPMGATPTPIEWQKLPIKLEASLILVPRGEPRTEQQKYGAELTAALAFYRSDNFSEAAERLADVGKKFPRGLEAKLYFGVSELKLGRNSDAIAPLLEVQDLAHEPLRDDATWYLALAYERVGKSQDALSALETLCKGTSIYKGKACTAAETRSSR
jgi:tetratricopeptide (TPR) repeat protein